MTVGIDTTSFHELADEAFLMVAECERLAQNEEFSWNHVFLNSTGTENEKKAHDVLNPFLNTLGDRFDQVLSGCGYECSVVIYFMPGTWVPLPVFVTTGQFAKTGDVSSWQNGINEKSLKISSELRHSGMPITRIGSSHRAESHVFFFAHQYVSFVGQAFSKGERVSSRLDISQNVGNSRLSIWIDLQNPPGMQYKLPLECDGNLLGELSWVNSDHVPLQNDFLFISPIFLNDDTMVLMASYFNRDKLKQTIKSSEDMQYVLGVHGSLARQVFSPLYTAMLRGDMARLRLNLRRNNISAALLDCAAKHLDSISLLEPSRFSYAWKDDNGNFRYSDDFRWSIYGDIIKHPDSVFAHVLFLEKSVYEIIQQSTVWDRIEYNINPMALPSTMPLSGILRAVEELGRALGTTDRDHILHQFHVFVFGTLIIRTEGNNFLKAFAQSLYKYCDIGDIANSDKCLGNDDERLVLLLQAAWFLVSTCHDIGRPVQMVDKIIESLREKVGELVHLDTNAIGVLPKFRVDTILYDDPRTYLLLRELATAMATWLDKPENIEDWWFFFRYMAFEKKSHAFVSALSLGLALTEQLQRYEFSSLFVDDNYGRFIASQILIPIILHHSYDWYEEEDGLKDLEEKARKSSGKKKENIKAAVNTIKEFLAEKKNIPHVPFAQFPLAILLAVTDYLQEDGRPSGSKREHWPEVMLPDVKMWEKDGHLNLLYKSTLQYSDPPLGANMATIKTFQSKQTTDVSKKHNRSNRMKAIFDVKALKYIFLEATCIQFGDHPSSIFKYIGESFIQE